MRESRTSRWPLVRQSIVYFELNGVRGAAIAVTLLLCSCAGFSEERGRRLEQRVDRIEGEASIRQGDGDRAAADPRVPQLEARIEQLAKKVDALGTAAAQRDGEHSPGQDELRAQVASLRAALEAQGRRLDATEGAVAQRRTTPSARVAQRESSPARSARAAPQIATARIGTAESPARAELAIPSDKTQYLAFAREQESSGQKGVARDLYEEYVKKFPGDPTTADAHFRLGELAFGERRYRDAAVEFGKVAKEFPRSDKAPDALLRTADSMLSLNLHDEAIAVLSEIPKRYPGSPAAARATDRLSRLTAANSTSAGK